MTAARPASRRPVAMLAHSYVEEDPRVRREATTLVEHGHPVDVFALRRPGDPTAVDLDGVHLIRLDVQRHQGAGLVTYVLEYAEFLLRALMALTRSHRRRRYALVQVHTLPDLLVLAALPLKLLGVPVLLDLHEAMPEFFRVRFPRADHPLVMAALRAQERLSIALADHAITVNRALAQRLVGLGVPAAKVGVVTNAPLLARFDPTAHATRAFAEDGVVRLVYAGALSPIYELDVVLEALVELRGRGGRRFTLELYGRDFAEVPLRDRVGALGLTDDVTFHGRIPIEDVPAAVARADIGLAPTRRSPFTDFSLSTKIYEYAAMGKPVVASALPMVEETFGSGTVATYRAGDAGDLADVLARLADDAADRDARVAATRRLVEDLAWEHEGERYTAIVEDLIDRRLSSRRRDAEETS